MAITSLLVIHCIALQVPVLHIGERDVNAYQDNLLGFYIIRGRCNRQYSTDQLDTIRMTMFSNKGHHYFGLRSSCVWVKKATALRKISFIRFSSRTARSRTSGDYRSNCDYRKRP